MCSCCQPKVPKAHFPPSETKAKHGRLCLGTNWRLVIVEKSKNDNVVLLSNKAVANRRNAQLSTGPKTREGKNRSR